ncbi:MAG: hypothetical protein JXO22_07090 [Phycisphaerae bacterium]|nr:hypothetical protein [Phycisphaerae bacterium]
MDGCWVRRTFVALLMATLVGGCDQKPPAQPSSNSSKPTDAARVETPPVIIPESADWSAEEALVKLGDRDAAVSAAVRLVLLAGAEPVALPDPLPLEVAETLRVVNLGEAGWALGIADRLRVDRLWGPVLIGPDGAVMLVMEDSTDAVALCIAKEPEVFPHLLISRGEVRLLSKPEESALMLIGPPAVGFALRHERGIPYVALVLWADRERELTRYTWQPYEKVFYGPAMSALPADGGGVFELDLEDSAALEPVGGIIEEPKETPEVPVDFGDEPLPA